MPNAKDANQPITHRILVLGNTGTGKTAQFATFPGKKYAYFFDASALITLRGQDIDYDEFLPTPLRLDITSLEKNKDGTQKGDKVMSGKGSEVYLAWEKDVEEKIRKGFFKEYDWIGIDSGTTLLDVIMDRMLTINGRPGTFPQQDDWGPQMVAFANVMRTFIGMGVGVYLTGHLITDKDEHTQSIVQIPLMTGRLREKIPLIFTDVFKFTAAEDGQGSVRYVMETVPNQRQTPIRTSIKGLIPKENITIDWNKPVIGQGLGGILTREKEGKAQHDKG